MWGGLRLLAFFLGAETALGQVSHVSLSAAGILAGV